MSGFCVVPASFERRSVGPIWGEIFFRFNEVCFPSASWSDIVVPIITEWLTIMVRVDAGSDGPHELLFMDGPYSIKVSRINQEVVSLVMIERREAEHVVDEFEGEVRDLFENAVSTANRVLCECHERGWLDRDTESLSKQLRTATRAQ